eukprot:3440713-Rhodomonas_salina.1
MRARMRTCRERAYTCETLIARARGRVGQGTAGGLEERVRDAGAREWVGTSEGHDGKRIGG